MSRTPTRGTDVSDHPTRHTSQGDNAARPANTNDALQWGVWDYAGMPTSHRSVGPPYKHPDAAQDKPLSPEGRGKGLGMGGATILSVLFNPVFYPGFVLTDFFHA